MSKLKKRLLLNIYDTSYKEMTIDKDQSKKPPLHNLNQMNKTVNGNKKVYSEFWNE